MPRPISAFATWFVWGRGSRYVQRTSRSVRRNASRSDAPRAMRSNRSPMVTRSMPGLYHRATRAPMADVLYRGLKAVLAPCADVFFRLRAGGAPRPEGAFILAANHSSLLDWVFVARFVDRPIRFVLTREFY